MIPAPKAKKGTGRTPQGALTGCRVNRAFGLPRRQGQPGFESGRHWLPDMDLNHDKQIQSLLCYRYTIGQSVRTQRLGILG